MSGPKLIPPTLLPDDGSVYHIGKKPETTSERVKRLQVEAQILAREQIEALGRALKSAAELAHEISEGGEAYPVGVREIADRMADELPAKAQTLEALLARIPEPKL